MTDHTASAETRRAWFSTMVRIRHFEDKVQELFMSGAIGGTTHLCQGQEAVSVGSIAAMRPGDVQTNTYRGHGEALALGMTPETAFAELMGKTTGGSGGVGGSMHLIDFSKGNIGANAIVGAGPADRGRRGGRVPDAGAPERRAHLLRRRGDEHRDLPRGAQHGRRLEGAGRLHHHEQPVRRVLAARGPRPAAAPTSLDARMPTGCRASSSTARTSTSSTRRSADAVERARGGEGPTLLEMKTYRYRGHSRSDPAKYRPDGELEAWKARDPIEILGARLAADGILSADDQARIKTELQDEVDAAADRAAAAPYPTLEETRSYVYAD